MTEKEALIIALEALEANLANWNAKKKAIPVIKEVLAQAEPVIDKSAAIRIATSLGWEPKRTWVGLMEEDFSAINQSCLTKLQAATSAESILKEKNT
jgi:riboflavin synthase